MAMPPSVRSGRSAGTEEGGGGGGGGRSLSPPRKLRGATERFTAPSPPSEASPAFLLVRLSSCHQSVVGGEGQQKERRTVTLGGPLC